MNPQTMAEKILSKRGSKTVFAGDLAVVEVDNVMIVDSIVESVIEILETELEALPKFPERVSIVIDHVAPASSVNVAKSLQAARAFAACRAWTVRPWRQKSARSSGPRRRRS